MQQSEERGVTCAPHFLPQGKGESRDGGCSSTRVAWISLLCSADPLLHEWDDEFSWKSLRVL